MITLRQFRPEDAGNVCRRVYPGMAEDQAQSLIAEWGTCKYGEKLFLMMGIWLGVELVGTVSLFEETKERVSFGIEISPEFRRKGYATSATKQAMTEAKSLGYQTMTSQVRQDNIASIALHKKIGFTMTNATVNSRGREVFLYELPL